MKPELHLPARATWALAGLLLSVACGPKSGASNEPGGSTAGVLGERPTADGSLIEQQIDLDGDGDADVYNFWQERSDGPRLLVRKESDLNRDGKIDVRTSFDASGQIVLEEMDGDFDGTVDWTDHYQGGKRTLSEVDTNYDGAFDLFKIYESGRVSRKERDTNNDGRTDFWEYLDAEGNVVKVGRDVDGDGVMDVRED